MSVDAKIRQRVSALIERGNWLAVQRPQKDEDAGRAILNECAGWIASATHVLELVFPSPLGAYRTQVQIALTEPMSVRRVGRICEILKAMLVDIDAGLISSIADAARGEVFDDLLDHAAHYLSAKKVAPAGVVAGVAFEDALRRACEKHNIVQKDVDVEQLISALVKKDLMNNVKASRARAAAAVRTKATHAQWDEFKGDDVEATIATTRDLVSRLLAS